MVRAHVTGVMVSTVLLAACRPEPLTLGIATGPSTLGAAVLAYEDAVAAGLDVPVDTVIIQETNNRAEPAIRAAHQLVATPGLIGVLGHSNSPASLTAAPIYNQAGVVQLASHSTADFYSEAGPYSFRMVPPDSQQGRILAAFVRDLGVRRVALTYVNDDYGRGLRAAVLAGLPDNAIELVVDAPQLEDASPDVIRRAVRAMVDARPEAVIWLARTALLDDYIGPLREALGRIPIVGGDALNVVEYLPDPDELYPPMHFVQLVDLEAHAATRRFKARYRERFSAKAPDAAALAYDAFSILLAGIRDGARTGEELREYLVSLGHARPAFQGITGPVQFDEHGDATREYVIGHLRIDSAGVKAAALSADTRIER